MGEALPDFSFVIFSLFSILRADLSPRKVVFSGWRPIRFVGKIHRFSVSDLNPWIGVNAKAVVAPFARRHLWSICAAVSVVLQRIVARFARRHLTRICAAVSVRSQYVVSRFARRHLKGICAAISVGFTVRGGSRVLVLILLVFVHHYNRARRLRKGVLPLEPPGTTAIIVVQYSRPHTSPSARGMVKLPFVPKCSVGRCPTFDVHRHRR